MSKHHNYYLNPEFEDINNEALTIPAGPSWNGPNTVKKYKWCNHKGDKVIYEHAGKKLYGAAGRDLDEFSGNWDLIIDLASNIRAPEPFIKAGSTPRFNCLSKYARKPLHVKSEVLKLDWWDGSAPSATLDFWINLWPMLPEKTVICCIGGHGRTGTCIAALIIASGTDYYTAVDMVRTEHCEDAIESVAQELYLHGLYVEWLERLMKTETSKKDLLDIKADLEYARSYVPTAMSSYGLPVVDGLPAVASDKALVPVTKINHDELDQEFMKTVGDKTYFKVCANPSCKKFDCEDIDHLAWCEWNENECSWK